MILNANALNLPIADKSVQCVVTSPPYYGLRDYGALGQLGLEPTPEEYVNNLVLVFREVWRVLKDDGTLWLNLGDSYSGSGKGDNPNGKQGTNVGTRFKSSVSGYVPSGLKPKDLIGIPWLVAFALRADGWYLRQDIIWSKPNPMPESVTDRCTKSHEYVFLLTKSARYYYDNEAIKEPCSGAVGIDDRKHAPYPMANKRSVWTINTQGVKYAHFATYPEKLVEPCILAGSRPGDLVLDPFSGSGTTGRVAIRHGRKFIGCELNFKYISEIAPIRMTVQPLLQELNNA